MFLQSPVFVPVFKVFKVHHDYNFESQKDTLFHILATTVQCISIFLSCELFVSFSGHIEVVPDIVLLPGIYIRSRTLCPAARDPTAGMK